MVVGLRQALGDLQGLARAGAIHCAEELTICPPLRVLEEALATFATYHPTPVVEREGNELHVRDGDLLLYYRNRLTGYGLLGGSS
jgi:glycerol-3-phosphate O-acyltransferase